MRFGHRLALASLLAAALLCGTVAAASANRLRVSETAFRLAWNPNRMRAYLGTTEGTIESTASCNVTMEGSFSASTFAKSSGPVAGTITRATVARETCEGGTIAFLTETLPWQIFYASFTGTLPAIVRVNVHIVGLSMLVTTPGWGECLARTTAGSPMVERVERERGSAIEGLSSDETIWIVPTGLLCTAGRLVYEGKATVTRQGSTGSVSLTLI